MVFDGAASGAGVAIGIMFVGTVFKDRSEILKKLLPYCCGGAAVLAAKSKLEAKPIRLELKKGEKAVNSFGDVKKL